MAIAAAPATKTDELEELIRKATGEKTDTPRPNQARPATRAAVTLPPALEAREIHAGLASTRGRVRECYDRFRVPGQVSLRFTIAPSGEMRSVKATGLFAGTPTGACVEAAFRSARFRAFAGPALSMSFPVLLKP